MKKKRYLPFGYRMIGGRIEIISEESDLVQNIFCSYLAGASLQQLAKLAEQTGLHFRENANAWNKNMCSTRCSPTGTENKCGLRSRCSTTRP